MKCLNTHAKLVAQKLYEFMYQKPYMIEEGVYAKIDKNPAYMPVVVEKVGHLHGYGEIISIVHYGRQNGDSMADPDMEFVIVGGDYYPISYRNDYLCQQQDVFSFDGEGKPERINTILQEHLTRFANHWLQNLAQQQDLINY